MAGGGYIILPVCYLLLCLAPVYGEVVHNNILKVDRTYESAGTVCIRPWTEDAQVMLRMDVESSFSRSVFIAGNTDIDPQFLELHTWLNISFTPTVINRKHWLDVTVAGNEPQPFTMEGTGKFSTAYYFYQVILFVKGKVDVSDCPPPPDTTSTLTTSSSTTTTTTTTPNPYEKDGHSWLWVLGGIGPVPVLVIVLLSLLVVVGVALVRGRALCRRESIANDTEATTWTFKNNMEPLDQKHSNHHVEDTKFIHKKPYRDA